MKKQIVLTLFFSLNLSLLFSQNILWSQQIKGPDQDECTSVCIDQQENCYVLWNSLKSEVPESISWSQDFFSLPIKGMSLTKYSSLGAHLWTKEIKLDESFGLSLMVDVEGNIFVSGGVKVDYVKGLISGAFGLIVKISPNGEIIWEKELVLPENRNDLLAGSIVSSSAVDTQGNLFFAGEFLGFANFGFGTDTLLKHAPKISGFVMKTDPAGDVQWIHTRSGNDWVKYSSISIDGDGNLIGLGRFIDSISVPMTKDTLELSSAGGEDFFLEKISPQGELFWIHHFGGGNVDVGKSVTTDSKGNIYVSGVFCGEVDFAPGPEEVKITSVDFLDAFLAKFSPEGNLKWVNLIDQKEYDINRFSLAVDHKDQVHGIGRIEEVTKIHSNGKLWVVRPLEKRNSMLVHWDENGTVLSVTHLPGNSIKGDPWLCIDEKGNLFTAISFEGDVTLSSQKYQATPLADIIAMKISVDENKHELIDVNSMIKELEITDSQLNNTVIFNRSQPLCSFSIKNEEGEFIQRKSFKEADQIIYTLEAAPGKYRVQLDFPESKTVTYFHTISTPVKGAPVESAHQQEAHKKRKKKRKK